MKEIIIPSSVKIIRMNAFGKCSSLSRIILPSSNSIEFENNVFTECSLLPEIPAFRNSPDIAKDEYKDCLLLKKVVIPSYIKLIG